LKDGKRLSREGAKLWDRRGVWYKICPKRQELQNWKVRLDTRVKWKAGLVATERTDKEGAEVESRAACISKIPFNDQ